MQCSASKCKIWIKCNYLISNQIELHNYTYAKIISIKQITVPAKLKTFSEVLEVLAMCSKHNLVLGSER